MQQVIRQQKNLHPIFNDIDRLYAILSKKNRDVGIVKEVFDNSCKSLLDLFAENGIEPAVVLTDKQFIPFGKYKKNKNIIVCFSGGKDSIATVKYYMSHNYKVYLYHLKHINPPLYDECYAAKEIADYLHLPIYIDDIKLIGKHDYIEHPMKNMIIASGALQWGIRRGIGSNIAFGNYTTSSLDYDNFEFCGGDDMEMWDAYNEMIQPFLPGFHMNIVLDNLGQTLETVCHDKKLLDMSISCLGRASMRPYWHNWVKSKYGVELPKHRCGRCYKCCIEYIYMADHDLQEYSEAYYKYCFGNLKKNVEREDGILYTDEEVWNHYVFYDIGRSKYYG